MSASNVIDMDANLQQRRPNLSGTNNGEDSSNTNFLFSQSVASSVGNYVGKLKDESYYFVLIVSILFFELKRCLQQANKRLNKRLIFILISIF